MKITYTFPADCPVPQLRGVTFIGGQLTKTQIDGQWVDAVVFQGPLIGDFGDDALIRLGVISDYELTVIRHKQKSDMEAEREAKEKSEFIRLKHKFEGRN